MKEDEKMPNAFMLVTQQQWNAKYELHDNNTPETEDFSNGKFKVKC